MELKPNLSQEKIKKVKESGCFLNVGIFKKKRLNIEDLKIFILIFDFIFKAKS